jgi:hypothetical protein
MTTLFGTTDVAFSMKESVSRVRLFDGPLELSWHHCATTSDFIADLFALRYQSSRTEYREVRHCIGYLANELIENAMKFRALGEIMIEASMDAESFKMKVSNVVDGKSASEFQTLLAEITVGDPSDHLIQRIEANAAEPEKSRSGLGLLTLMSDYGAHLAWIFSPSGEGNRICLETYASLVVSPTQN